MELSDAQIDQALAQAYRLLADDAADGLETDPNELMQVVLDELGEFDGSADQVLVEMASRGLLRAFVRDSPVYELGNENRVPNYSVDRIELTREGLARGQESAGSL